METRQLIEESNVKLGIEIEIENQPAAQASKYWHCKPDGSLRHGIEYVFVKPFDGKKSLLALDEFYNTHLHQGATVSPRTAIHVHIDVGNCNNLQMQKMCVLYAILEEPLFEWIGEQRHINNHCLPWFNAPGDLHLISKSLNSNSLYATSPNINRYAALNLNAVNKFGSVEFRHLKTTRDPQKVIDWVGMIVAMRNFALNYDAPCGNIVKDYSNMGQEDFIKNVFPKQLAKQLPKQGINIGLMTAIDLLPKEKNSPSMFQFLSWGNKPKKKRTR